MSDKLSVIGVIDSDSFEVSIYQKLEENKHTIGLPCIVSTGVNSSRIVSVSPEAKKKGISRSMTVQEAKEKLPGLCVIPKGTRFNKPENKLLRIATFTLRNTILDFFNWHAPEECFQEDEDQDENSNVKVEINGCDEFFLDLSVPAELFVSTNDEGSLDSYKKVILECSQGQFYGKRLAILQEMNFTGHGEFDEEAPYLAHGAAILQRLCEYVKEKTGYVCSGGVSCNKLTAKIACKLFKPEGVVALTKGGLDRVANTFNFQDITGFGSGLGDKIKDILRKKVSMAELKRISLSTSSPEFRKLKIKLTNDEIMRMRELSQGIGSTAVEQRLFNKNVSSGKNNLSFTSYDGIFKLKSLMRDLATELAERIEEENEWNKREATEVKFKYEMRVSKLKTNKFRQFMLPSYEVGQTAEKIMQEAWSILVANMGELATEVRFIESVKFTATSFNVNEDLIEVIKSNVRGTKPWYMSDQDDRCRNPIVHAAVDRFLFGYTFPNDDEN